MTATISLGWCPEESSVPLLPNSLQSILSEAQNNNFTFINVPIQATGCSTESFSNLNDLDSLKRWQKSLLASSDRNLFDSNDWSNRILFKISLKDPNREILFNYAAHLTVFAVLIEDDWSIESVLEVMKSGEAEAFPFKFYFKCDFFDWKKWKSLCDALSDSKISNSFAVVPELKVSLKGDEDFHYKIWHCENIKGLIIDSGVFLKNSRGYPVLPRQIQEYLQFLKKIVDVPIILKADKTNFGDCALYVRWLLDPERSANQVNLEEKTFIEGFENVLQTPLQPLKDHLPSETYEIFEKDPVKYRLYEEAITAALKDKAKSNENLRVGVFGAGRGPLVQAALNAAEASNCKIRIVALEKSPNACLTLLDRFKGHAEVEIVYGDMRSCSNTLTPKSFDLIVSELLGSFGDNELSPECLWPVENFLKPDGTMIPEEYTSYLEPCYAPVLQRQVQELEREGALQGDSFDYGYVVYINRAFKPSSPQPLFTFKHPRDQESEKEISILRFDCFPHDCPVDGLIGYFDCKLYGNVRMSTVPSMASPGMLSWFPMYFPLKTPTKLEGEEFCVVEFRRLRDTEKVWYEWQLENNSVQNQFGKSFTFKLQ